jgi:hypothetical protein
MCSRNRLMISDPHYHDDGSAKPRNQSADSLHTRSGVEAMFRPDYGRLLSCFQNSDPACAPAIMAKVHT